MKLLLATTNRHKRDDLIALLAPLHQFEILTLDQFPDYQPPEEDGVTFEENAILKATKASNELGLLTLGEDTGLVVPALGGAPGVRSARYASENATDSENRKKLLKEMKGLTDMDRDAYFECAVALASPQRLIKTATGRCEGTLLAEERGQKDFGYTPLFVKHGYRKTMAELEDEIRRKISHRYKAIERLMVTLEALDA